MLTDMKMLAMPDCLEAGVEHAFTFQARVRNKQSSDPFEFLNMFIYFKQSRNAATRRGFEQRSIVLACTHYHTQLAFKLLTRLVDVIDALPTYQSMLSPGQPPPDPSVGVCTPAQKAAIEVAFEHFKQWPRPQPGRVQSLPFYGEMIEFMVPELPPYVSPVAPAFSSNDPASRKKLIDSNGFGSSLGVVGESNLVAVFEPLGLVPHLWTIWELVVTGQDIVIYAPSAAICSACVMAIASLVDPLACCADIRPYINNYDSDCSLIAAVSAHYATESYNIDFLLFLCRQQRQRQMDILAEQRIFGVR
jgi:hypothetical protein